MTIDHGLEPKGRVLRFRFLFQDYTPDVTLEWGRSLLTFEPNISHVGQNIGVSMRIWVSSIKTEFVLVLSWDFDRQAFDLKVFPGFGDVGELLGGAVAAKTISVGAVGPAAHHRSCSASCCPSSTAGSHARAPRSAIRRSRPAP